MKSVTYAIPNISCNHCVHTIKRTLENISGVSGVSADASTKEVNISFEEPASEMQIKSILADINYPVVE